MNPFDALGVSFECTEKQLKKAYRRKARKLHPDVNKSPTATEEMKALNAAYGKAKKIIKERGRFDKSTFFDDSKPFNESSSADRWSSFRKKYRDSGSFDNETGSYGAGSRNNSNNSYSSGTSNFDEVFSTDSFWKRFSGRSSHKYTSTRGKTAQDYQKDFRATYKPRRDYAKWFWKTRAGIYVKNLIRSQGKNLGEMKAESIASWISNIFIISSIIIFILIAYPIFMKHYDTFENSAGNKTRQIQLVKYLVVSILTAFFAAGGGLFKILRWGAIGCTAAILFAISAPDIYHPTYAAIIFLYAVFTGYYRSL